MHVLTLRMRMMGVMEHTTVLLDPTFLTDTTINLLWEWSVFRARNQKMLTAKKRTTMMTRMKKQRNLSSSVKKFTRRQENASLILELTALTKMHVPTWKESRSY